MKDYSKGILVFSGIYNLLFALFHLTFWSLFNWDIELKRLSYLNNTVMQILNLRLTYVFFLIAYILIILRTQIITTKIGRVLLVGWSLFWLMRAGEEVYFAESLDVVTVVFTVIFLFGGVIHYLPIYLGQKANLLKPNP